MCRCRSLAVFVNQQIGVKSLIGIPQTIMPLLVRKTNIHGKLLAVLFGLAVAAFITQAHADCEQISPHPNPASNTISSGSSVGCNKLELFDNFGTVVNSGTMDNSGAMRNFGKLINIGTLNNFGDLTNIQSRAGHVRNTGAMNNFGRVSGYGSTENSGILNNFGTFNTGDFGNNTGVVNNYSDAVLLSAQRYTNDGVVNNSLGATVKTTVGWINNGAINNSGTLNFENSRFLNNNGVLNNRSAATFTIAHELNNRGLLRNEGMLANDGRISNSSRFLITESGSVTGPGNYNQSAGTTVINGSMTQAAARFDGGVLSGGGSIMSVVVMNGSTIAPGNAIGVLTIRGAYRQTATGRFAAEIGGPLKGVGYDYLDVSGTAALDGQLDVSLYDFGGGVFSPTIGDTFEILHAESIVGRFSKITLAPLSGNRRWEITYVVDAYDTIDVVRLGVVASE